MKDIGRRISERADVLLIYLLLFVFFVGKVNFYQSFVQRYPDEGSHLAYIAYLETERKLLPNFREMYSSIRVPDDKINELTDDVGISDTHANYLGHPPLYYQLMRLSGGICIHEGRLYINLQRLRDFSQLFCYAGVIIAFYIGYTRLRGRVWHLLYGTIIVSVPMLAYDTGLSNDVLNFLGVAIVMLALLRLSEGKRNAASYWLLAVGVFVSILSKLTGGLIIVVACFLFVVRAMWNEKSARILLNHHFFMTLPLYAIVCAYFLNLYFKYGTVQPSLALINPDYYYQSGFYVVEENRIHYSFLQYAQYFLKRFLYSWTGIHSHVSLEKRTSSFLSLNQIGLVSILALPLLSFFKNKKSVATNNPCRYLYVGSIVAFLYQFYTAHNSFVSAGYLGGTQARYHLVALPAMAFLITEALERRWSFAYQRLSDNSRGKYAMSFFGAALVVLFCGLLIYEDFGYFLTYFTDYLIPLS